MLNGFSSGAIIFFLCTLAMEAQAFNGDGKTAGWDILGATMYTCVVWVVNLQMALAINYFTLIQHILIWSTIAFWYLFLVVYGSMPPSFSKNAYKIFIEALFPAPFYWIVTILVSISALVPYFVYSSIQMRFFPMYHEMIQWIRYVGRSGQLSNPEYCEMVQQKSLQPNSVGFTARAIAAKSNGLKDETYEELYSL